MTELLPDSSFVVLALVAEGEAHGYELLRLVHERGFRFWTKVRRSSIYNALASLEHEGLISVDLRPGEGPDRKVYKITKRGSARLAAEAARHLAAPSHPNSEIDLGIYALPFISPAQAGRSFKECETYLRTRRAFLAERLAWCRENGLALPALAFERPLLVLDAELAWLERVRRTYADEGARADEWARYENPAPQSATGGRSSQPSRGGSRRKPAHRA